MSSWKYVYFFSNKKSGLRTSSAIIFSFEPEFKCDGLVISMKEDDEGHCVEYSTDNWDAVAIKSKIAEKISKVDSFQVTYKSPQFFFNVVIAQCNTRPYVCVAWPYGLFMKLPLTIQNLFLNKIDFFATSLKPDCAIFLKDAPGFFEDRVSFFNETLCIDTKLISGRHSKIDAVWITEKSNPPFLSDSEIHFAKKNENGFDKYIVPG